MKFNTSQQTFFQQSQPSSICLSKLGGLLIITGLINVLGANHALAWGERGHHAICTVATRLVEEPGLKPTVLKLSDQMASLCNAPDVIWRRLEWKVKKELSELKRQAQQGQSVGERLKAAEKRAYEFKVENSSHYIEPDSLGLELADLPLSLEEIFKSPQVKSVDDLNTKMGTSWWRAEQFFNRARSHGSQATASQVVFSGSNLAVHFTHEDTSNFETFGRRRKKHRKQPPEAPVQSPGQSEEDQEPEMGEETGSYDTAVGGMLQNMGLMGHFVGDAAQPFHNVGDYNGFESGHGGIHSYFESDSVNHLADTLEDEVYQLASGNRASEILGINLSPVDSKKNPQVILERMRELSVKSASEINVIYAIDSEELMESPTLRFISQFFSVLSRGPKVHRAPASVGAVKFKKILLPELARASLLLARFWDEAYRASGSPSLAHYDTGSLPTHPSDIPADYALDSDKFNK